MTIWNIGLALLLSYLVGSIPFGWLVVKIASGKDIRTVESGRTGGTNAMRAAGFLAGLFTAGLDVLKGISTAWIAGWLVPGNDWVKVAAALLAIIGHNYSVFLIEKTTHGRVRLGGRRRTGHGPHPAAGRACFCAHRLRVRDHHQRRGPGDDDFDHPGSLFWLALVVRGLRLCGNWDCSLGAAAQPETPARRHRTRGGPACLFTQAAGRETRFAAQINNNGGRSRGRPPFGFCHF